jgi:hypothetical protein
MCACWWGDDHIQVNPHSEQVQYQNTYLQTRVLNRNCQGFFSSFSTLFTKLLLLLDLFISIFKAIFHNTPLVKTIKTFDPENSIRSKTIRPNYGSNIRNV